ncbi:polyprenyl synthetase family protein [Natronorubrum halophilum]|uniref:farnesyltranstransferase n=1 Tax=Natronorubrum halophilum TaxID=1702106 RepID=UPI000EF6BE64|nr:farnesyltranstransferase [Natronorubrum halophilum]
MRETITRRRAAIEDALRNHLPDVDEFEQYREGPVSIGRPRTRGQVFLALFDGFSAGTRVPDRILPIAVALELASLQTRVHRTALERPRSTTAEYDPTRDILRGDLLESTAFETMLSVRASPRVVQRCFGVLVRASRRVQEGNAMDYGAETVIRHPDLDVGRRFGALTGGAAELARIVTEADDYRRRLIEAGSAFEYHLWLHLRSPKTVTAESSKSSTPVDVCRRQIDALADCCPSPSGERVRRQLRAFLEESTNYEAADSRA